MRKLTNLLQANKVELFRLQHRDGKKKRRFSLRGSFKIGVGSTQPGHLKLARKGIKDFIKHPFKNTGVFVRSVKEQFEKKSISKKQFEAYNLAKEILEIIDPKYANGAYITQFAYMNSKKHFVLKHKDTEDISFQYALSLGDYKGARLRVYDSKERSFTEFDNREKILKFDGRNSHEVVTDDFEGERFTVIWYKNYDETKAVPDPVFHEPHFM